MADSTTTVASCHQYELEIAIDATAEKVWNALFQDTNVWWLPDFHVAGPDSTVVLDPSPAGRGLLESTSDGGGLQWYSVQMYLPKQMKIYLVGHIAPEWGGPATSNLKLSVESTESGCIFKVTDARHGNIDEQHMKSYEDGWTQLFTDGLKAHVEKK